MLPNVVIEDEKEEGEDAGEKKVVKRPRLDRKVDPWIWHAFENPARGDQFQLHHWVKVKEQGEPYQFSRFNKKLEVIRYSDQEYLKVIEPI